MAKPRLIRGKCPCEVGNRRIVGNRRSLENSVVRSHIQFQAGSHDRRIPCTFRRCCRPVHPVPLDRNLLFTGTVQQLRIWGGDWRGD